MYSLIINDAAEGPDAVEALVSGWVATPALRRIVEAAGGNWPEEGDLLERLKQLHAFSDRWDFRRGGERLDIAVEELGLDSDWLMTQAAELQITTAAEPDVTHYHHALVLGGTALASINRVRRLADLREHGVTIDHPAALTALRKIGDPERDLVRGDLAPLLEGAEIEFDVLVSAVAHYLGGRPSIERQDDERSDIASATATVGDAIVLAAPSDDPNRRANTSDNYRVYADRVHDGERVLVVTSSIYLPYQHFLAILALGWERPLTIDATGFPPEWMGGVLTGPQNVLQELRSGFFGALRLLRGVRGQLD
jgi:hypothetical protein